MIDKFSSLKYNRYFDTYLRHVRSKNVMEELSNSLQESLDLLIGLSDDQFNYAYAPDKWTIAQVMGHCIETEQIFNYRALTIARSSESVTLSGFDENEYAAAMYMDNMVGAELVEYATNSRKATLGLHKTLSETQLRKVGMASGHEIQVEALFYITVGHFRHHNQVIKERYLA